MRPRFYMTVFSYTIPTPMQIPQALQHFAEPALIVTADHMQTRILLAFEDSLEEVERLEERPTLDTDNETSFVNVDTHGVNGPERSHQDQERFRHFIQTVATRITKLVRDEDAARSLHIIAPTDVAHALRKDLPNDVADLIGKEIHADIMKEDDVQILERLFAA